MNFLNLALENAHKLILDSQLNFTLNISAIPITNLIGGPLTVTPKPLSETGLDFNSDEHIEKCIERIIQNFAEATSTIFYPVEWYDILNKLFLVADKRVHGQTANTRNALLSIYITYSRVGRSANEWAPVCNLCLSAEFYEFPLPEFVKLFINTDRAQETFKTVFGFVEERNDKYPMPPTVYTSNNMPPQIRGWVCMNGCIVINQHILDISNTQNYRLIDLCTLVAHETMHGSFVGV